MCLNSTGTRQANCLCSLCGSLFSSNSRCFHFCRSSRSPALVDDRPALPSARRGLECHRRSDSDLQIPLCPPRTLTRLDEYRRLVSCPLGTLISQPLQLAPSRHSTTLSLQYDCSGDRALLLVARNALPRNRFDTHCSLLCVSQMPTGNAAPRSRLQEDCRRTRYAEMLLRGHRAHTRLDRNRGACCQLMMLFPSVLCCASRCSAAASGLEYHGCGLTFSLFVQGIELLLQPLLVGSRDVAPCTCLKHSDRVPCRFKTKHCCIALRLSTATIQMLLHEPSYDGGRPLPVMLVLMPALLPCKLNWMHGA